MLHTILLLQRKLLPKILKIQVSKKGLSAKFFNQAAEGAFLTKDCLI